MQALPTQSFSRSSSMTSIDSSDAESSRRTRKRFTSVQLMMLENLFHHDSHPSRQERETLAKAGDMEIKSVTIWFQNKRQMERRGALGKSTGHAPLSDRYSITQTASQPLGSRPSLDQVASRSERPQSVPHTPTRRRDPARPIWESMPSSPPVPVMSPPAKDFVEFGKLTRTRTLEWACARRRLATKSGHSLPEDDADKNVPAIVHRPVLSRSWSGTSTSTTVSEKENRTSGAAGNDYPGVEDDTLKAALALCGLGRG